MAQEYKGKRIDELLDDIAQSEILLRERSKGVDPIYNEPIATAWATLAIAKAKLTALQGED